MTQASNPAARLLAELVGLEGDARMHRVREAGPAPLWLGSAVDEAARLINANAADALAISCLVVDLADREGTPTDRARARRVHARALSMAGRLEESLAVCRVGIELARTAGDVVEAARLRLASMHALGELGRLDEAIEAGEAARAAFDAAGEHALAARADINLGGAHQRRGDSHAAFVCLERARRGVQGDQLLLGVIDNNRGEALLALNEFTQAEQAFADAQVAFEQCGAALNAAIAEGNRADLAARQGRLGQALPHFEHARHALETTGAAGHAARLRAETAEAMAALGMPREAVGEYESALAALDAAGLALEAARARRGLGLAHLRLGRWSAAETALAAAALGFEQLGHAHERAKVDLVRAELAQRSGRGADTRALVLAAMRHFDGVGVEAAACRLLLARLAMRDGRHGEAEGDLTAGVAIADELGLSPLMADLLTTRGIVRRAQGRLDEAAADLDRAIAEVERVRGTFHAEKARAAFLGDREEAYDHLAGVLLERSAPGDVDRAFEIVERAKSRSLLDAVSAGFSDRSAALDSLDADDHVCALLADHERTQAELNALYTRVGEGRGEAAVRERIRRCEDQLTTIALRLASAQDSAGATSAICTLAEAQQLAGTGAIIAYAASGDMLTAFVIRRDRVVVVRDLARQPDILEAQQALEFQVNRALRPGAMDGPRGERLLRDAQRELHRLWTLLLAPVARIIDGADRLTIAPVGTLHLVPWNALWDGERYLIDQCEVHTTPSASVLAHLERTARDRASRTATDWSALCIGVADDHAPRMEDEARAVADLLAEHGSLAVHLLIGSKATIKAVRSAMPAARIIHIATHGVFRADAPEGSGLLLADGWLTARHVHGVRLNADVVTLSGCETGASAVQRGDELSGLVRSFLSAGAGSVVVSLWKLHDEAAEVAMNRMYGAWLGNSAQEVGKISVSQALREAQLELRRTWEHPAWWGSFITVGRASRG